MTANDPTAATHFATTAGELANALWGATAHDLRFNASLTGCYDGTTIPVRRIDEAAPVTLVVLPAGGRVDGEDWIADRFGSLGRREAVRALDALRALALN
tara:strand:- start:101 stop:400 length:300 start_codon:yes stop_codon:yes gene_type:complete